MKNYIVTHTFKSKEAKAKMIEVTGSMSMEDMTKAMTGDNAKCQMSWNTPGDNLTMYCWWKGKDQGMDAHNNGDHAKSEKLLNEALALFKS